MFWTIRTGRFPIETPEVMITRRYYRSGESEYYINKQSARLRDINELLMDTGLGREGYSNIGQGRIDEILAQKSTDRREILKRLPVSPNTAIVRRRPSAGSPIRRTICFASETKSRSWNCRSSPFGSRRKRRKSI